VAAGFTTVGTPQTMRYYLPRILQEFLLNNGLDTTDWWVVVDKMPLAQFARWREDQRRLTVLAFADHPLDPISLAIELLAVADRHFAVRLWWDDGADTTLPEIVTDCIGVVGLVGEQGVRRLLWQIDQSSVKNADFRLI
jgi:hypothetical protein